jgi:hypothetical protein
MKEKSVVRLTEEDARTIRSILDDPNHPSHEGKEMPTITRQELVMDLNKSFKEFQNKYHGVLTTGDLQTIAKFIEFLKEPSGIAATFRSREREIIDRFNTVLDKGIDSGLSFQEAMEVAVVYIKESK